MLPLRLLKARDFRCFERLDILFGEGLNFFVGANAQGKTSLLEAVCVVLRLASPRTSTLASCIRHDRNEFALLTEIGHPGLSHEDSLRFRYGAGRTKFLATHPQGHAKTAAEYLSYSRVVWFGGTDLDLVRGRGEGRRRYLDFLGAQLEPFYRTHARAYERALRSRNRLLKSNASARELQAWEGPLLESGRLLTELRAALVAALAPHAAAAQLAIRGPGADATREHLVLQYAPGAGEDFAASLAAAASEDRRLGQTTVGPHRDDLRLLLDGLPAAEFASEGQQRTVALALRLAQAGLLTTVEGAPPLLLLDDIFGELDPVRRNALLTALPVGSQQLITTTHLDWMREAPAGVVWRLESGAVQRDG